MDKNLQFFKIRLLKIKKKKGDKNRDTIKHRIPIFNFKTLPSESWIATTLPDLSVQIPMIEHLKFVINLQYRQISLKTE